MTLAITLWLLCIDEPDVFLLAGYISFILTVLRVLDSLPLTLGDVYHYVHQWRKHLLSDMYQCAQHLLKYLLGHNMHIECSTSTTGNFDNNEVYTVVKQNETIPLLLNSSQSQRGTNHWDKVDSLNAESVFVSSETDSEFPCFDAPVRRRRGSVFETRVTPKFRPRARSNSIVEAMIATDTRSNSEWKIQSDITIEVDVHLNETLSAPDKNVSLKLSQTASADAGLKATNPSRNKARNLSDLNNILEDDEDDLFDAESPTFGTNQLGTPFPGLNGLGPRRGRRLSLPVILH